MRVSLRGVRGTIIDRWAETSPGSHDCIVKFDGVAEWVGEGQSLRMASVAGCELLCCTNDLVFEEMTMSDESQTEMTVPGWMQSEPKEMIAETTPPASGETKKARKPRRTKAQMLADAAARPDARESLVDTFTVPDVVANVSISTTMAAEDHRDAVVRDIARIAPRRVTAFFRWFDLWIGAFVDTRKRIIYVCPLPMIGVAIRY